MSDGRTEAMRGTYFSDRSSTLTEREKLERKLRIVEAEIQDLQYERENLKDRIKKITER